MSDATTVDLTTRVRQVIATTFEVDPAALPPEAHADSVEEWDSLGHMQLIEALEEAFGIELDHADAVNLLSQSDIVSHLEGRLGV